MKKKEFILIHDAKKINKIKIKTTANHAAAISHKHWCEAVLEKLDCLRGGGDGRVSGCARLNNIEESRLFMYILNNSDILFRFG